MSESFDAYHVWLGISPAEQPPNHYRLLGLAAFESDKDVIANAADRQMAHLRTLNTSKRAAIAQELLNEIAAAQICLLDAEKKAAYDAQLKKTLVPAAKPPAKAAPPQARPAARRVSAAPPAAAGVRVQVETTPRPSPARGRTQRGKGPVPWGIVAAAGLAAVVLIVVVALAVSHGGGSRREVAENPKPKTNASATKRTSGGASDGAAKSTGPADSPFEEIPNVPVSTDPSSPPANAVDPTLATPPNSAPAAQAGQPAADELVKTALVGGGGGGPFENKGSDGALLAGFEVTYFDYWVKTVRPYYRTQDGVAPGTVVGNTRGGRGGPTVLAKDGYAVGGIVAKGGRRLDGFRLVFMRVQGDRLDPADHYESEWLGFPGGGPETLLGGDGRPVVGLHGRSGADIDAIGLIQWDRTSARSPPETPARPRQSTPPAAAAPRRKPVPDEAARAEAEKLVRELYAKEIAAARRPAECAALANTLAAQAEQATKDPVAQYVLFSMAREFAAQSGDAALSLKQIDQLAALYEFDVLDAKIDALGRVSRAAVPGPTHRVTVNYLLDVIDELVADDEFERATEQARFVVELSRKTNDNALVRQMVEGQRELAALKSEYDVAKRSMDRLQEAPDDAAANMAVARWHFIRKENVAKALPFLAKSGDALVQAAAEKEMAPPKSADERLAVAEAWYEAAQNMPESDKSAFLLRAHHWYTLIAANLVGLAKTKAEKRIEDIQPLADKAAAEQTARIAAERAAKGDWRVGPGMFGDLTNLGSGVNDTFHDFSCFECPDGLTMYFASARNGGVYNLFVATRKSAGDEYGNAQALPGPVNVPEHSIRPSLTADGRILLFQSDRQGGFGYGDIWMTTRASPSAPWAAVENLGPLVNTTATDGAPQLSIDGLVLVFHSNRPGGLGGLDIWMCQRPSTRAAFSAPANIGPIVNGPYADESPHLSPDGLTLVFSSNRPGGVGGFDIWVSKRASPKAAFGAPVNLGPEINSTVNDAAPAFSADGKKLYITSGRPGGQGMYDLWYARRLK
jgi:hypothetical protein